jgi:membrane protein DedA with SNARE-associated domain
MVKHGPKVRIDEDTLEKVESYFERHGGKTVFLGRWLPFLRITAAWLAGAHHMAWPRFLAWNAAGGIAWAISVGVLAYFAGQAAEAILHTLGYVALGVFLVVVLALAAWALHRRR